MSKPAVVTKGDTIEHDLMPGFRMVVLDIDSCETDCTRPIEHQAYKITDPDGGVDWLCAYDVHPA